VYVNVKVKLHVWKFNSLINQFLISLTLLRNCRVFHVILDKS